MGLQSEVCVSGIARNVLNDMYFDSLVHPKEGGMNGRDQAHGERGWTARSRMSDVGLMSLWPPPGEHSKYRSYNAASQICVHFFPLTCDGPANSARSNTRSRSY